MNEDLFEENVDEHVSDDVSIGIDDTIDEEIDDWDDDDFEDEVWEDINSKNPDSDHLDVSEDTVNALHEKAHGIKRSEHDKNINFLSKWCPTRHGCQGATNCDYSYGDYPA